MKIIIADTGALISLGHIGHIGTIEAIFGDLYISKAVWEELKNYESPDFDKSVIKTLEGKVKTITTRNHLTMMMDYGESESVILYEELQADFLLIDDNKARIVAESLGVNCIGSIGILIKAKQKGLVDKLKPLFEEWLSTGRYFSKKLLNQILIDVEESPIS